MNRILIRSNLSSALRNTSGMSLRLFVFAALALLGLAPMPGIEPAKAAPADLTYAQVVKLLSSSEVAGDRLGSSVAIKGDWAFAGALGAAYQGYVNIYKRTGQIWGFHQKLTASDAAANAYFGVGSIDIDGTTIVVSSVGAVYVFGLQGTTWVEQHKILPQDGVLGRAFGARVSIHGQSIVVGAPSMYTSPGSLPGAAYVFVKNGATWTQQQKLEGSNSVPHNSFGRDVEINGNTLAVVGHQYTGVIPSGPGKVHIFTRSGSVWTEQQVLTTTSWGGFQIGGLTNDTLVTGRYLKAQVYVRSGNTWTLQQELQVPDTDAFLYYYFGGSVAYDGDRIIIGTEYNRRFGEGGVGSAYIYALNGSSWEFKQKIVAADGGANDRFGQSVAVSGESFLVAASEADIGANVAQGAAYIFDLISNNSLPTIVATGPLFIEQGETLTNVLIATVNDAETPAGALVVDKQDSWSNGVLSDIANNDGQITATINGLCNTFPGQKVSGFNVFDSKFAVGLTSISVNILENPKPSIGTYPNAVAFPGGTLTVTPSAPPTDDGPMTLNVFSFGAGFSGFDGVMSVNQTTGAVTISNAGPGGSFMITVSVKDTNCSTITRSFILTVAKFEAPPTMVSSSNPSVYNRPVTFTVSIAAPRGAPLPTGLVQFQVDGVNRGLPARLVRGSVEATTANLSPGSHQITAVYRGDENYQRSSTSITQVVNR